MSPIPNDDVQTSKPQSSIDARREARIRKILENSKSRLDKLNGAPPEMKGKYLSLNMMNEIRKLFFQRR